MKRIATLILLMAALAAGSCNRDETTGSLAPQPPVITLDSETAVYTVKVGRTLTIAPTYAHVEQALYVWSIDGRVVGSDPTLTLCEQSVGEIYVRLEVSTRYGTAGDELRVDVVDLEIPTVSLPGAGQGYTMLQGGDLTFSPSVAQTSLPTTCTWTVDGETVSSEREFTYHGAEVGEHTLSFTAGNEDGEDGVTFTVRVCTADEMPFGWTFEQTEYNLSSGRRIRLMPLDITNAFDAVYTWTVDGECVQRGSDAAYVFTLSAEGRHDVTVTMENSVTTLSQALTVNVCPPEGRYYRAKSASSSADWNRVYAFLAAPGQFVNEGYSASTMEEACAYAEGQMKKGGYVSLGAFGGYIVVGFDHSVDCSGDYDLAIGGNSFEGSSEPGIVWVMQDENGDGLPNDTWYELKGSETGKAETLQDYAVTYYRPRGIGMEVQWTDNLGNSGTVDYLSAYHRQDSYYPAWVEAESYTLRGTCLKARNYDQSGNGTYWVNEAYDWGYADNYSPIDRLTDDPNAGAGVNANHFRISDAVAFDGTPANLKYIDFVKVQTGVQAKSGWLGELSTEVFTFYDYGMKK